MAEGTLKALAKHGDPGRMLPVHGGDCEAVLTEVARAGIDSGSAACRIKLLRDTP
jgi:transaldolase